jgi:hypothetical protein
MNSLDVLTPDCDGATIASPIASSVRDNLLDDEPVTHAPFVHVLDELLDRLQLTVEFANELDDVSALQMEDKRIKDLCHAGTLDWALTTVYIERYAPCWVLSSRVRLLS